MAILRRGLCWAVVGILLLAAPVRAEEENIRLAEQKIKAGLIYNFLKYTSWPAESMATEAPTLTFCSLADSGFDNILRAMQGRNVNQREIQFRVLKGGEGVSTCHALFVGEERAAEWAALRKERTMTGLLTIGDFSGFAAGGGMAEFFYDDKKVGVRLNIAAVEAARLTIEGRLLRLVTVIRPGGE